MSDFNNFLALEQEWERNDEHLARVVGLVLEPPLVAWDRALSVSDD